MAIHYTCDFCGEETIDAKRERHNFDVTINTRDTAIPLPLPNNSKVHFSIWMSYSTLTTHLSTNNYYGDEETPDICKTCLVTMIHENLCTLGARQ